MLPVSLGDAMVSALASIAKDLGLSPIYGQWSFSLLKKQPTLDYEKTAALARN